MILVLFATLLEGWGLQPRWKGPKAVLYMSLDGSDGLVFMEGTQEIYPTPLVSGHVCKGGILLCKFAETVREPIARLVASNLSDLSSKLLFFSFIWAEDHSSRMCINCYLPYRGGKSLSRGVSVQGGRCPGRSLSGWPPEGTWDQRQRPPCGQTNTSENKNAFQ